MNKLSNVDKELIEIATETLKKSLDYVGNKHHVAAAIRGKSGTVYTGINIDWWMSSCAEQIALGTGLTQGEREFEKVVAVEDVKGEVKIVPPCGRCRQMFAYRCPNIKVVIDTGDQIKLIGLDKLLPYQFLN